MKIRLGFVSNSSSSSFVCDLCGRVYSGWDADIKDAGMFSCRASHTLCCSHKIDLDLENAKEVFFKILEEDLADKNNYDLENTAEAYRNLDKVSNTEELKQWYISDYTCEELPIECCPICQTPEVLKAIEEADKLKKQLIERLK